MKYIIYCRKSSEAEDRQVLSIESQINELKQLAKKENLTIDKVFKESMSAKAPERPVFNEMMKYIKENKDLSLLVWKLDRLSRNPVDGGNLIWLLDTKDIQEIRTYEKVYKNISDDKFIMNIDFGMSKKFIDDLSVNVKRGNKTKLEKGGWLGRAPLGYKNNKLDRTIIVDRKISKYVVRTFKLYASGNYSIKEIVNILYEEGFRTKTGLTVKKATIHRMLNNPVYYGIMARNGKYYQGNHKPLIDQKLFDKAQSVLLNKTHAKKQKLFFTYRGFMKCSCGCVYTASNKKGHDYYYCTNGKGNCETHKQYEKSENVDKLIVNIFDEIKFSREIIEIAYEASKEKSLKNKDYFESSKSNFETELKFVQQKKNKLLDSYLSDLLDKNVYEAKMKELSNDEVALNSQIKNFKKENGNSKETLEQVKKAFLVASTTKKTFLKYDKYKKRGLLETLLWNLEIENKKIANTRFKMPYQLMANTPKNCDFTTMLGDRDSNPD